ncbi:MAG: HDIG domain-containing protein [Candidatus Cryptobacteroides sp.]|nr:HDIG domain-containing protein [Candidatus Cryptobacteroides sp.]
MKSSFRWKAVIPLVVSFAVLMVLVPRTAKWGYDYSKGQAWRYETLVAQFDFPLLKTTEQIAKEKADLSSTVIPYYKMSTEVVGESFRKIEGMSFADVPGLKSSLVRHLSDIYNKGIIPEIQDNVELIYVQKGKRAEKVPVSEVYLLPQARIALLHGVSTDCPEVNVDSIIRSKSIYDLLAVNLVYDEQITALVHSQTQSMVSTTSGFVNAGTIIVNNGELITAEVAQMLDSYKAEYEQSYGYDKPLAAIWLGNALLVLGILICLYFAIYFSNAMIFKDYNRYLYVVVVFTLIASVELILIKFAPQWIFIFPFSVAALYLQAFFRTRVIYPVYIATLLPLLLFAENGAAVFMMYLVSGVITLYVFKHFSKGAKQFIAASINFVCTAVLFSAFVITGVINVDYLPTLGLICIGSILQVALHPFVYLLERSFNLVSSTRLQELSDTSNELLRQLEQKAPGTFQHSLQVMNLASAAARAINADEILIKAGALYHDIGKIKNPLCFVENESLTSTDAKYHADITPLQSAQDIIKHVTDGVELAQAHKLPSVITDFIRTHHGTTCVSFFYDKYLKEGGDPELKKEFLYPGPTPTTKEQVILMLSDSIEAASRTLRDYSQESISALVDRIFAYKIEDGQLEQADITLKEIDTIKIVMQTYLGQMYHERIKYPKRKIK